MTAVLDKLPTIGTLAPGIGDVFYQCALRLRGGDLETTGWIEARAARKDLLVELKGEDGLWVVRKVYKPGRTLAWLREKQRKDRGSLGSVKGDA